MITEQYITSLFYSSMDSYLKKDIEVFDSIKKNLNITSGHTEENDKTVTPSLEQLGEWYDDWDTEFFFKIIISRDYINDMIDEINRKFDELIVDKVRTSAYNKEILQGELRMLMEASEEESLKAMTLYNDGSYIELPSFVEALSILCQINDFQDEWIRLYETMRVFPLKGALAYSIKTPQQCIDVLKRVYAGGKGRIDVKIFQKIFFHRTTESLDNLHRLKESQILDSMNRKKAEFLYKDLVGGLNPICSEMLCISLDCLGINQTVSWVIELRNRFINNDHPVNYLRLMVANTLYEELKKNPLNIKTAPANVENNIFYLSIIEREDKDLTRVFIDSLMKLTYRRFFNEIEPNKEGFEKLRAVYKHLSDNVDDSLRAIMQLQPLQEGYKINKDASGCLKRGNQFWLSVLFLQLEETKNEDDFKKLVALTFKYSSQDNMLDTYFIPFYIAGLVASQLLTNCKDWYEEKLITEYPDLVEVVRILTANGGKFSEHVTNLLRRRIEVEWELEMVCKPYYNKNTIKYLIEFLNNAGIDTKIG